MNPKTVLLRGFLGLNMAAGALALTSADAEDISNPAGRPDEAFGQTANSQGPREIRLARLLKEASLSPGVSDVARLAEQGTDIEVLTTHVRNCDRLKNLRPRDIAYLSEHSVPNSVVVAMIERGAELQARAIPHPGFQQNQFPPASKVTVVAAPESNARRVSTLTIIGSSCGSRGLSYQRYFYGPRGYYSPQPYTGPYSIAGRHGPYRSFCSTKRGPVCRY